MSTLPIPDRPARRVSPCAPLARACAAGLLALAAAAAATPGPSLPDEATLHAFLRGLRCVVCQNESLADSTAPLALDLQREIRARFAEGRTPEEVRAWLAERYGDFISYRPPVRPATGLLWLGPALLGGLALGAVAWQLRPRHCAAAAPAEETA